MKTCTKCNETLSLDQFHKRGSNRADLQSQCKSCRNAHKRIWREANKETCNANSRAWNANNSERRKQNQTKWITNNPEYHKTKTREWMRNHPEVQRKAKLKRKALKLQNGVFVIPNSFFVTLYNSPCIYCGSTQNIEADHVIPISRGGTHSIGNLAPACRKCNASKNSRTIMEWRKSLTSKPFVK